MFSLWLRLVLFLLGLSGLAFLLLDETSLVSPWAAIASGLMLVLVYHLLQLSRFYRWLNHSSVASSRPTGWQPTGWQPNGWQPTGFWGEVIYRLEKLSQSRQGEQQKKAADFAQVLEATRHLPDAVIILDDTNRMLWLNNAAEHLLGLSPQRDLGQFIFYLLRNSRFLEWLQREDEAQTLILELAGRDKTLALQRIALSHQQKMLIAHDMTEFSRLEAMRRDFIANVSHELRTPITVIVGFLEAFEEMTTPDVVQFRQHIPLLLEQSDRISRLVNDLLTLARLESEPDAQDETVIVETLLRRLVDEAETLSQGKHAIHLRCENQARLIGNGQELYSAFANLVTNAVRYTPAGGQIDLKWGTLPNGESYFSVQDSGEGIEARHIPRLTERFYRVDRGRSRASGGTGLGLAIVKHILQRHQARLRIESTLGKGSTFTAIFPLERVIEPVSSGGEG